MVINKPIYDKKKILMSTLLTLMFFIPSLTQPIQAAPQKISINIDSIFGKTSFLKEGDPGYENMLNVYTNIDNESALYYVEELRQEAEKYDFPLTRIYYFKLLSSIYLKQNNFERAITAAKSQIDLSRKYNYPVLLFDGYDKIANALVLQNRIAEAQEIYMKLGEEAKDVVLNADNTYENMMRLQKNRSESSQIVLVLFFLMIMVLLVAIIYTAVSNNRMLETVSEMKTVFVQNMSHEIRTPLNAIVGFSQLLIMPDEIISREEKEKYGEYIMTNSNLLTMLIDDILNLSDVESGNYRVVLTRATCNAPVEAAMKTTELRVPDGVRMYYTTEVDDSFSVTTDMHRVQQVLVNFITNACKHTEKGEIHINCSIKERSGYVTYSVTDTGTGVPIEKAEEIFERFTKLDAFSQGTGLGLSICRMIAAKLNGEVKLDTTYTNGARFLFQIPLN